MALTLTDEQIEDLKDYLKSSEQLQEVARAVVRLWDEPAARARDIKLRDAMSDLATHLSVAGVSSAGLPDELQDPSP